MQKKNLLFDLDGTLVNTKQGIFNSLKYCTDFYHLKELPVEIKEKFIGPPLVDSFMRYYDLSLDDALNCVLKYREYYKIQGIFECELYDGIVDLLESLQVYDLYVATSKPTVYAKMVLEKLDILKYFIEVVGSDPEKSLFEKEQVIEIVINEFHLNTEETFMIGDTLFDAKGANHHQIDFIGILYGFGTREEMSPYSPFKLFETPDDLKLFLKK